MVTETQIGDRFRYINFLREMAPAVPRRRTGFSHAIRFSLPTDSLEPEAAAFFDSLFSRWGLSSQRYRVSILSRRHAASLRATRVRDLGADERALNAVMIGVTAFFRDRYVFDAVHTNLNSLTPSAGPFTALSVGCSDGSELYSLGMLAAEVFGLNRVRLFGVDCRPAAIDAARNGLYSVESTEAAPEELRRAYLSRHGVRRVAVSPALKQVCAWRVADAFSLDDDPSLPSTFDVIMCRNLVIYLTPESGSELWSMLARRLRPGGLLVMGRAERPPAHLRAEFTQIGRCVYRKRSEP